MDTQVALEKCVNSLVTGTGPVAVDAERASGHRYGQRAFLVQLKRHGAGIWLIDPEAFDDLGPLMDALSGVEWILHAANQDLPCLWELGLWPNQLFDTELAGRLCGFSKVSLSSLLERMLGITLAKEHSAADWSIRPLPEDMRRYAALDVEFLTQLQEAMITELKTQGKYEFALEEFEALRSAPLPPARKEPWRKTAGIHKIKDRETLAVVRSLWTAREELAETQDVSPGRLISDQAIIAAAQAAPRTVTELLKVPRFQGRAATRQASRWIRAIREGLKLAKNPAELPQLKIPSTTPPPPRTWSKRDPLAAARYQTSRTRLQRVATHHNIPLENLLTPVILREICWQPPEPITPESVDEKLKYLGARPWQIQLTSAVITVALLEPVPLDPGVQVHSSVQ